MTCMWKGTIRNGGILCKGEIVEITTSKELVDCVECKKLLGRQIHKHRHVHLSIDFLSGVKIDDDKLSFEEYTKSVGTPMCMLSSGDRALWKITNNPKEITCGHCTQAVWGNKECKKFILTGLLVECGQSLKLIRQLLKECSNKELKILLDALLDDKLRVSEYMIDNIPKV